MRTKIQHAFIGQGTSIKFKKQTIFDIMIAIKGAGDLASGIACRLFNSNIRNICLMEIEKPLAVRRLVSFSESVYKGKMTIEGVTAVLAQSFGDIQKILKEGRIPVIVDPFWNMLRSNPPDVLIDAIMAKKNIGTSIADAQLVIGLGPGFIAGHDVDVVIETKRGHNLGRVLHHGMAQKNTAIPEAVNNFTIERVLRSSVDGLFVAERQIGDMIKRGEVIGRTNGRPVLAQIDGVLRGLIRSGIEVTEEMKVADIDPRGELSSCYSISDKARTLGGAVLEAVLGNYQYKNILI